MEWGLVGVRFRPTCLLSVAAPLADKAGFRQALVDITQCTYGNKETRRFRLPRTLVATFRATGSN